MLRREREDVGTPFCMSGRMIVVRGLQKKEHMLLGVLERSMPRREKICRYPVLYVQENDCCRNVL